MVNRKKKTLKKKIFFGRHVNIELHLRTFWSIFLHIFAHLFVYQSQKLACLGKTVYQMLLARFFERNNIANGWSYTYRVAKWERTQLQINLNMFLMFYCQANLIRLFWRQAAFVFLWDLGWFIKARSRQHMTLNLREDPEAGSCPRLGFSQMLLSNKS